MDIMVQGPPMRSLIEQGYLSDYKIICPPSDMAMIEDVGASGDWSPKQLREASQRSHIVGDVVATYLKFAAGKLGITFSTDVETAEDITRAYRAAGVRAETLTGKTDSGYRRQMLKQYARREIDQIVAVDIVSEGFDLPAIEVASLARPTASLSLYMQQFGRALRILEGKSHALIIDHVGNTVRHNGTPDKPREWTLDRRDKKSKASAGVPIRVCLDCFEPFERILIKCPNCGSPIPEPAVRSSPAQVDGDLVLLDDAALAILRGQVAEADKSVEEYAAELAAKHVPTIGILANRKRHAARLEAQKNLREAMALWGGKQHNKGLSDREIQKAFYLTWGIDVLSAMALGTEESIALERRISDKKP
jgi:superfamily II DNA or RNA helicase